MQIYVELALAENFCMDFTLLYCAKAVTKNLCSFKRIAVSSALGACFAVVFPLFGLNGFLAVAVKLVSGALLCLVCGKFKSFSGYLKFSGAFAAFTFVLGGALLALFAFADISFESGGGYLISSAPIGIPMFVLLILALSVRGLARKIVSSRSKIAVKCKIYNLGNCVAVGGFFDSGNRVYHTGQPVSVISRPLAEKLTDLEGIKTFTQIHTVSGSKKIAVFTADKVEIDDGKSVRTLNKVKIGVAENSAGGIILHPDLSEVN